MCDRAPSGCNFEILLVRTGTRNEYTILAERWHLGLGSGIISFLHRGKRGPGELQVCAVCSLHLGGEDGQEQLEEQT